MIAKCMGYGGRRDQKKNSDRVFFTVVDCQRNLVSAFFCVYLYFSVVCKRATHENDGAHIREKTISLAQNNEKPIYLETFCSVVVYVAAVVVRDVIECI